MTIRAMNLYSTFVYFLSYVISSAKKTYCSNVVDVTVLLGSANLKARGKFTIQFNSILYFTLYKIITQVYVGRKIKQLTNNN